MAFPVASYQALFLAIRNFHAACDAAVITTNAAVAGADQTAIQTALDQFKTTLASLGLTIS